MKPQTNFFNALLFLLFLSLLSCNGKSRDTSFEMAGKAAMDTEAADESRLQSGSMKKTEEVAIERKLIKEGQVEFETDDMASTRKQILESAEKYEGYIASDEEYKYSNRISNTIVIRVPAKNFDDLLAEATRGVSKFDGKNITTKDVTEEFLDIEARLKTKKELENTYLELLKKAKTVPEVLEVERELGQVRADIESIEGRLKYLTNRVSFSTLSITFYQSVPHQTAFGNKFKNGFKNGWDNLIWFFVALVNIWPFILLAIALIFGIRAWRRKKKA